MAKCKVKHQTAAHTQICHLKSRLFQAIDRQVKKETLFLSQFYKTLQLMSQYDSIGHDLPVTSVVVNPGCTVPEIKT